MAEHGHQLLQKLLAGKIDWNGIAERKPSARHFAGAPVPVIEKNSAIHSAAAELHEKTKNELTPITEKEMATLLYKLQGHYWQPNMSESLARETAKDYLRLLSHYGLGVFSEVYDEIITEPDRKFCPTIGELKDRLDKKTTVKNLLAMKLEKLLSLSSR